MNVAVARYYGVLPLEKTSAEKTGLDVSDVLDIRQAYVEAKNSGEFTKVASDFAESEPWLLAWDIGEEEGKQLAKAFFKSAIRSPEPLD